jgi:8-hydroxy-5-deazaflavin:NADPH oxidoreductase
MAAESIQARIASKKAACSPPEVAMKIGVLGTGMVGAAIGGKLVQLGHEVRMGSRTAGNEKAVAWAKAAGAGASEGTFADAAAFGELVFVCTSGQGTLEACAACGTALDGKVVIDVSNPLVHEKGKPPTLFTAGGDSLGERLQDQHPKAKVVKSLNTMNCHLMVDATRVPGDHDVFVSGNDAEAKAKVTELLRTGFGWKHVVDLGDITTARGTEEYLMLWIRLWGVVKSADFNIHVVRK